MKTICFYNRKGGVGKTSITGAVACELTLQNKKVCMIDTDSQANLSSQYCQENNGGEFADVLFGDATAAQVVKSTKYSNLFIIPSKTLVHGGRLDKWTKNEGSELENRHVIQKIVDSLKGSFDYLLFDTAPAYNALTKQLLLASNEVIPVLRIDQFSIEGLKDFYVLLNELKDGLAEPEIKKIIFNSRDKRLAIHKTLLEAADVIPVEKFVIPFDSAFGKSQIMNCALQAINTREETAGVLQAVADSIIKED